MKSYQERARLEDRKTPFTSLTFKSRQKTDSPLDLPHLSDFERLLRNSSSITSRNSLTLRRASQSHSEGLVELFISRGNKTMQLSVGGLTSHELGVLVSELDMKEIME